MSGERVPGGRWRHLEFDWEWGLDHNSKHATPPPPTLTEDDTRPVAGRILGPSGNVLKVVRHGPEPLPFGFEKDSSSGDAR